LRFAQPRAIGLKVSDEFTVPLCRGHHRELHQAGNENAWWEKLKMTPLETAKALWEETHPASADISLQPAALKTASPDQESVRQTVDQQNEHANDGLVEDATKASDAN
jgi:hypothetical protein